MGSRGTPERARLFLPIGAMWLYERPDTASSRTGDVDTGMMVTWYPESVTFGKLQDWYWVEGENGSGWLPSMFGKVEFAPIPPLNTQAAARVRSEVDEAISVLVQTINDLSDWLVSSPQMRKGVFA